MRRCLLATAVLALSSTALAQNWATYVDQTATRLVAANGVGISDPEEKSYTFGDFDQDGDIDVAVGRKGEFTIFDPKPNVLFMNEGIADGQALNGVLVDRTSLYAPDFATATNDRDIEAVDVNGDGWIDLVSALTLGVGQTKALSHPRVYINLGNNGQGDWQGFDFDDVNRMPTFSSTPAFASVAWGDIDGDGDFDLYFTDYSSSAGSNPNYAGVAPLDDRLLLNNGNGYFTDVSTQRMTTAMLDSAFGTSGQMADMNNDGTIDVVKDTALFAPQRIQISYNNPSQEGFFNKLDTVNTLAPYFVQVADLNNDGRKDVIAVDDGTDRYHINTGNGADGMADFITLSFSGDDGFGGNAYATDINNDGWKDVVVTDVDIDIPGCNRRMHIYRNLGNAPNVTLQEQGTLGISTTALRGTHDVAMIDINGDGWVDMLQGTCDGTRVYINEPPGGLIFSYPQGLPGTLTPNQNTVFQVQVTGLGGFTPLAGSGKIFVSVNGGAFAQGSMTHLGNNLYSATLPGVACASSVAFYVSSDKVGGGAAFLDPSNAPVSSYQSTAGLGLDIQREEFEGGTNGWTVNSQNLTSGTWQQVTPVGTLANGGQIAAPFDDATAGAGNTKAWVTQNGAAGDPAAASDVDGGPTNLVSPAIDLAGTDARIEFAAWFFCDDKGATGADVMTVAVSNNDGATWTNVMTIDDSGQAWTVYGFWVSQYVTPSANVRVRFSATDNPNNSLTEAGVDNFEVKTIICAVPCPGDLDGDGDVDQSDLNIVLANFASGSGGDLDGDGDTDQSDLNILLANFGTTCN